MPAGAAAIFLNLVALHKLDQRGGKVPVILVRVVVRLEAEDIAGAEVAGETVDALGESLLRVSLFTEHPVDEVDELPAGLVGFLLPAVRQQREGIALLKVVRFLKAFPEGLQLVFCGCQRLIQPLHRILFLPLP